MCLVYTLVFTCPFLFLSSRDDRKKRRQHSYRLLTIPRSGGWYRPSHPQDCGTVRGEGRRGCSSFRNASVGRV